MNFIKRVLSTVVGIFVFCIICVVLFMGLAFIFSGSAEDTNKVTIKTNSVLELKLDFPIKDYADKFNFKGFEFLNQEQDHNGLFDLIAAIDFAATDDKIKGISITNNVTNAGISQIKALRDALLRFKDSGKFIISYADIYTQADYYLNSVADEIFISPVGGINFKGLETEQLYFKDFQDQSGIKFEVVRLGRYKSAVEPYLENKMSSNNREQITEYLNDLWTVIVNDISTARNIPVAELNTVANTLGGRTAALALQNKLVDKVAYIDEYETVLRTELDIAADDEINHVSIRDYAQHVNTKQKSYTKDKIAVIYAEGIIIYGDGNEDYVGQGVIRDALKEAREDDKIKAVVIRINSPGGSALASELIWREIELTKAVKPVVVSMGDVAASGGYYIACNANTIIAEPTTITGSIGVFATLPNVHSLANKWGINAEQVVTHDNTLTYSFFEPLSDTQRTFIKESILDIYDTFTQRVANGRGLSQDEVKAIAEGRVWTGVDALEIGLVDELGGLDLALEHAAELANISEYAISEFPIYVKDFEKIFRDLGFIQTKNEILEDELGAEAYKLLKHVQFLSNLKGTQMLFPYSTEIK